VRVLPFCACEGPVSRTVVVRGPNLKTCSFAVRASRESLTALTASREAKMAPVSTNRRTNEDSECDSEASARSQWGRGHRNGGLRLQIGDTAHAGILPRNKARPSTRPPLRTLFSRSRDASRPVLRRPEMSAILLQGRSAKVTRSCCRRC
jgi:hypothetical protein